MRKEFLAMAVFAGMLAFTSCSNDDNLVTTGNETSEELKAGEGILEIGISNTGIGSRDARPVGSSAASNNVNKVKLVAYKQNGDSWTADNSVQWKDGAKVQPMELDWTAGPNDEGASTDKTHEAKKTIKLTGLTASTKYKLVAYGFNGTDFTDPYGSSVAKDGTLYTTSTTKTDYDIEELFAGSIVIDTDAKASFKATSIKLTRQVAGILAYFKNVPSNIDGKQVKTIKVIANKKIVNFRFPAVDLGTGKEFNGVSTGAESDDVLMTFDLSTLATNYGTVTGDDAYTFNTVETDGNKPFATGYTAPNGMVLVENSIFGARFIMPYDQHYDAQTLTVVMYDTEGNALKTLNVTTNQVPAGGTAYQYDIRCNNFYSIGKKLFTNNTTGIDPDPDPENPNPDPNPEDKPIDLSKDNITVIINDAWNILHDMDVE